VDRHIFDRAIVTFLEHEDRHAATAWVTMPICAANSLATRSLSALSLQKYDSGMFIGIPADRF